jgi:hypothetical protein
MGSGNRSSARNVLLFNSDNVLLGGNAPFTLFYSA